MTLFLEMLTLNVGLNIPDPAFAGLAPFDFENCKCNEEALFLLMTEQPISDLLINRHRDTDLGAERTTKQLARCPVSKLLAAARAESPSHLDCCKG